ncbi:GNAT family N-acetyltransferase [Arthrobacter sp. 1P04PC]|uniref:GNAT family N-acetyltransferase n=1 Tax=unclassified Arthrobacter TaxID=235627 RepID=UPI0039A0D738
MDDVPRTTPVRTADLDGPDAAAVGRLVAAYLVETEREKAARLGGPPFSGVLPERYRREVENPARAYSGAAVLVADSGYGPAGVITVHRACAAWEIKRVWVDPASRGQRVGAALLDTALKFVAANGHDPVRLTVWDWREDAIRLYRRGGFVPVPSWEDRHQLLCMERPAVELGWPETLR